VVGVSAKGDGDLPDSAVTVAASTDDVTTIVAMAAHELKNALSGIGVAIARCEQRLRGGKTVTMDDLAIARAEVRRLSALVNDLLDGARVDLGVVQLRPSRVDLTMLAREVVEIFNVARERNVTLELPSEPVVADADPERVRAVLINYLENAAKYAPEPAPIAVVLIPADSATGLVRIAVRDGGPGIQLPDQKRLFQRFFRAPSVAKRTQGLGLGLYLCRAIARAHGGSVGLDSTPGHGATFWLDLPGGTASSSQQKSAAT
jgi:signal transduction histidine kinase